MLASIRTEVTTMVVSIQPIQKSKIFLIEQKPGMTTLKTQVEQCGFDAVDFVWSTKTEEEIATRKKSSVKAQILWFQDDLDPEEASQIVRALGHKPAHLGHLLEFAARKKHRYQGLVVALGTIEEIDGWRHAPLIVAQGPVEEDDPDLLWSLSHVEWDRKNPDAHRDNGCYHAIEGGMGVLVLVK